MKTILKTCNLYCLSFLFLAAMNACQNDDTAFLMKKNRNRKKNRNKNKIQILRVLPPLFPTGFMAVGTKATP